MPARLRAGAAVLAAALVVVACSDGAGDDDGDAVTLRLLTHESFAVSDDVLASFTRDTGIAVEVVPAGDAGETVNQAILTKDDPLGDVLYGVDNTFLARALDEDIFRAPEDVPLDVVAEHLRVDAPVVPIDFGDVCLNYDKAWFDERGLAVPQRLEDLTDPAYRDLLVVENPATSSPGLAFLLATVARFGEEGDRTWRDYWADLRANGVQVTPGWEQAYFEAFSGSSGQGERPLVVSYASSPPAEVLGVDPPPAEAPTGVILDGCFRQVEYAGVLRGTDHAEEAERLIEFMLSRPFQEDLPLNMFVFPARTDAALPEVFQQFTEVPDAPLELAPDVIAEHRDRWVREWTEIVAR